jgi:hypothetical protein
LTDTYLYDIIYVENEREDLDMIKKNEEKAKRKARRLPPIPYTRKGKTKQDIINRMNTKHKNSSDSNY